MVEGAKGWREGHWGTGGGRVALEGTQYPGGGRGHAQAW